MQFVNLFGVVFNIVTHVKTELVYSVQICLLKPNIFLPPSFMVRFGVKPMYIFAKFRLFSSGKKSMIWCKTCT